MVETKKPTKRRVPKKTPQHTNALVNRDSAAAVVTVIVLTIGLALASFVLSFEALQQLAAGSAIAFAPIWPFAIDGFIVVATIASYVLHDRKNVAWYPWAALIVFAMVSILGNGYHATLNESKLLVPIWVASLVSAAPSIALLVSSHLLVIMLSSPKKKKEPTVVEEATLDAVIPSPRLPLITTVKVIPQVRQIEKEEEAKPKQLEPDLVAWTKKRMTEGLPVTGADIAEFLGSGMSVRTGQRKLRTLKSEYADIREYTEATPLVL